MSPQVARRRALFAEILAACALLISLASPVLTLIASEHQSKSTSQQVCDASNDRIEGIRESLLEAKKLVGKKGQAGYKYYKDNPAELPLAKARIDKEIQSRWQNIKC